MDAAPDLPTAAGAPSPSMVRTGLIVFVVWAAAVMSQRRITRSQEPASKKTRTNDDVYRFYFKIGPEGTASPFSRVDAEMRLDMDELDAKKALAADPLLHDEFFNVDLPDTSVHVLRSVAGDLPTAAEEADRVPLACVATLQDVLEDVSKHPKNAVFVRVTTVPIAAAAAAAAAATAAATTTAAATAAAPNAPHFICI